MQYRRLYKDLIVSFIKRDKTVNYMSDIPTTLILYVASEY